MIRTAPVPVDSNVRPALETAYFHDSFEVATDTSGQSALEIYLDAMTHTPAWMNFLMLMRNRIVALFGLKNLGRFSDIDRHKSACSYQIGDRVGIFSIFSISNREVVLRDDDHHLDAKVSVYKYPDEQRRVAVTTVVHVHNFLGRAYLFFVVPAHKLIVPAMLAQIARKSRNA